MWRAHVLGRAELERPDGRVSRLERKLAACLSYLALEGPSSRTRLAGLLWPDSPEATARNNLSQMLRKLRLATGADLLTGGDLLDLSPELWVDAAQVRETATQGRLAELLAQAGELLPDLRYDDCPDLDDWLTAERERFLEWRAGALRAETARLEREGDHLAALDHARALLDLDPVSEEAHRLVMRLHYLRGDRPAALRAYQQCREVLRREFGVEPLPETVALARDIDLGRGPTAQAPRVGPLPLAVQRPPQLVGREAEWAQMEAAWGRVKFIYIRGAPGSGKTRLASDFAASRGAYLLYSGCPGDAEVPFASVVRMARTVLERFPDIEIADWVRREMARVLPELARPGEVSVPMTGEADVLRLRQAMQEFFLERTAHLDALIVDDWQFYDLATNQNNAVLWSQDGGEGPRRWPPMIITGRRGETAPESEAVLLRLIDSGLGLLIDLEALADGGVDLLLTDLGVSADPQVRARLRAHSAGNPLFVLETVRHLLETGQLDGPLPDRLPLPPRVGQLIERRLSLLSTPALQAARAAAVLSSDFDVELVAQVLGAPILDLLGAWEELEAAQVMQGERFSHDLVFETVRAGIPASVRPLLNRGAARALEGHGAHPARVAQHWQDGGKPALAAPQWMRAAEQASARYLLATAAQNFGQAAAAFGAADQPDEAVEALLMQAETLGHLENRSARESALRDLFAAARRPLHLAQAWHLQAELHTAYHEGSAGEAAARQGLAALSAEPQAGVSEQRQRANLEADVGAALWVQGQVAEAAEALGRVVLAHEAMGDSPDLGANLSNLGVVLDHLERHREATEYHRRACAALERLGRWSDLTAALSNLAVSLIDQGEAAPALVPALRANELLARAGAGHAGAMLGHLNTGQIYHALAHFGLALDHYDQAARCTREGTWHAGFIPTLRADTRLLLGDLEGAARDLEVSRHWPQVPASYLARTFAALADLALLRGGAGAEGWLAEAEALLGDTPRPFLQGRLWLLRAQLVPAEEALALTRATSSLARAKDLGGLHIAAQVRLVQALMQLGRVREALDEAREVSLLLTRLEPAVITRGEALLTVAQVLNMAGEPDSMQAAGQAHAWLRQVLDQHVPADFEASFLVQPVQAAILQLAQGAEAPDISASASR